jgi:hypothetical protein
MITRRATRTRTTFQPSVAMAPDQRRRRTRRQRHKFDALIQNANDSSAPRLSSFHQEQIFGGPVCGYVDATSRASPPGTIK